MKDDELKNLSIKLCDQIETTVALFMVNNLQNEQETTDVINLIMSSHFSACFNMMIATASVCDNKEILPKVETFITQLKECIGCMDYIRKMEELTNIKVG